MMQKRRKISDALAEKKTRRELHRRAAGMEVGWSHAYLAGSHTPGRFSLTVSLSLGLAPSRSLSLQGCGCRQT